MKMSKIKKFSSLLLCLVLIAAMALTFTGCVDEVNESKETLGSETPMLPEKDGTIGEGNTSFNFTVTGPNGETFETTVQTDKTTVADALLELGLIEGEDSEYGIYVKTVNGITVDYEKDGKYWAFYIDGEYAMTGVDATEIVAGSTYTFKAE